MEITVIDEAKTHVELEDTILKRLVEESQNYSFSSLPTTVLQFFLRNIMFLPGISIRAGPKGIPVTIPRAFVGYPAESIQKITKIIIDPKNIFNATIHDYDSREIQKSPEEFVPNEPVEIDIFADMKAPVRIIALCINALSIVRSRLWRFKNEHARKYKKQKSLTTLSTLPLTEREKRLIPYFARVQYASGIEEAIAMLFISASPYLLDREIPIHLQKEAEKANTGPQMAFNWKDMLRRNIIYKIMRRMGKKFDIVSSDTADSLLAQLIPVDRKKVLAEYEKEIEIKDIKCVHIDAIKRGNVKLIRSLAEHYNGNILCKKCKNYMMCEHELPGQEQSAVIKKFGNPGEYMITCRICGAIIAPNLINDKVENILQLSVHEAIWEECVFLTRRQYTSDSYTIASMTNTISALVEDIYYSIKLDNIPEHRAIIIVNACFYNLSQAGKVIPKKIPAENVLAIMGTRKGINIEAKEFLRIARQVGKIDIQYQNLLILFISEAIKNPVYNAIKRSNPAIKGIAVFKYVYGRDPPALFKHVSEGGGLYDFVKNEKLRELLNHTQIDAKEISHTQYMSAIVNSTPAVYYQKMISTHRDIPALNIVYDINDLHTHRWIIEKTNASAKCSICGKTEEEVKKVDNKKLLAALQYRFEVNSFSNMHIFICPVDDKPHNFEKDFCIKCGKKIDGGYTREQFMKFELQYKKIIGERKILHIPVKEIPVRPDLSAIINNLKNWETTHSQITALCDKIKIPEQKIQMIGQYEGKRLSQLSSYPTEAYNVGTRQFNILEYYIRQFWTTFDILQDPVLIKGKSAITYGIREIYDKFPKKAEFSFVNYLSARKFDETIRAARTITKFAANMYFLNDMCAYYLELIEGADAWLQDILVEFAKSRFNFILQSERKLCAAELTTEKDYTSYEEELLEPELDIAEEDSPFSLETFDWSGENDEPP